MAKEFEYLNDAGLAQLAKGILLKVNNKINERIVQSIGPDSDEQHVASAAATYRAIINQKKISFKTVIGDIDVEIPIEERSTSIIYLQKDNDQDPSWNIYIWNVDEDHPNGEWICIGDTEIDLSGYWSKSPEDMADLRVQLGIDSMDTTIAGIQNDLVGIGNDISTIQGAITGIQNDISDINDDIDDIVDELEKKVNEEDLGSIPTVTISKIINDAERETDPFIDEVATATELVDAVSNLNPGESATVRLAQSLDLTTGTVNSITIPVDADVEIVLPTGEEVKAEESSFFVSSGASLTLTGGGTIKKVSKSTGAAIKVENGGELNLNGVKIDCTLNSEPDNWSYGVYAKNSSVININPGTEIKVMGASCVSTNNTTGGSTINIDGAKLYSGCGYAVYCPAQGVVNINDSIVQGIHARMGTINVTGRSQIIDVGLDESNSVSIGANIGTSGSVELGDTIVLIGGSYNDPNGIDIELNIGADCSVASDYRGAIGIYMLDTKAAANVVVNVANGSKVKTTDVSSDDIAVYDHDYITASATAAGKTYNPVATSDVVVNVNGSQVYPQ